MSIKSKLTHPVTGIYWDKDIRQKILDQKHILSSIENINLISIPEQLNYQYAGDFNGLLNKIGISFELHWIISIINNIPNSMMYNENNKLSYLKVPNENLIQRIINIV